MKSILNNTDKNRINSLDGLRAFCALGVIWIHVYSLFGRPSFQIFGVDLYKPFIILGNGVDFFFVISGFCLYLVLYDKKPSITMAMKFIWNRFWRIAPAYYTAVLVYAWMVRTTTNDQSLMYSIFSHCLFISNYTNAITISGPFWSIVTEWSFYLLLPFIIIKLPRLKFVTQMLLLILVSFIFSVFMYMGFFSVRLWETSIITRFPEFAVGILACYCYINNFKLPASFRGIIGLSLFILITILGRILGYTSIFENAGSVMGPILHAMSNTVMTAGFALVLFHVISYKSILQKWLSGRFSVFLGSISYSIYLWHSFFLIYFGSLFLNKENSALDLLLGLILTIACIVIFSWISYVFLEKLYIKYKRTI